MSENENVWTQIAHERSWSPAMKRAAEEHGVDSDEFRAERAKTEAAMQRIADLLR